MHKDVILFEKHIRKGYPIGHDFNQKISNNKGKERYIKGGTRFLIPDWPDSSNI
jgi:hypothetical protein